MSYRPYNVLVQQAVDAASGASTAITYTMTNASGGPVSDLTPVTLSSGGDFKTIDVSVELDALRVIGITSAPILNASEGPIVGFGRMTNVTTLFTVGTVLYVSKLGTLIASLPDIGVDGFEAGDFVIKIGKIAKNQQNPSNKDLIVQVELIGQL